MNVSGSLPIALVQRLDDTSLVLRMNQRIAAEVLQVAGDQVVLALEGTRLVARLASPDQAAALAERRVTQFIVRDVNEHTVTLQVASPRSASPALQAVAPDLVLNLLRLAGLPTSDENVWAARALLSQGLLVTPELLAGLKELLAGLGAWGQEEAGLAAAMQAAGLPLSPAALALLMNDLPPLPLLFERLRALLRALPAERLPPGLQAALRQAAQFLEGLAPDWTEPAPRLAESLRAAARSLGGSLEAGLASLAHPEGEEPQALPARGWMLLARLRGLLAQAGISPALQEALDRFLESARQMHYLNSRAEQLPDKAQWLQLDLPLANPAAPAPQDRQRQYARLRIAYRAEGQERAIDPNHTRLVVQVALQQGESLEVDLSVVSRQIGARLTASTASLRQLAEAELPGFSEGLERLGYTLQTLACAVGPPSPSGGLEAVPTWSSFNEVNLQA